MTASTGTDERAPEPAPANNLPDWSECAMRVENSDYIAKRVAEGGYGPDADSKLATELHRFIYEYDDADAFRSAWFMHRLEKVLDEVRASLGAAQVPAPLVYALCEEIGNLYQRETEFDRGMRFAAKRLANAVGSQVPYVSQPAKESPCIPTSCDSTMRPSACAGIAGVRSSGITSCAKPELTAGAAQVPSLDAQDAARYRHLVATCNVDHDPSEPWQLVIWEPATGEDWKEKLDAAIDASIAALTQPSQQGTK